MIKTDSLLEIIHETLSVEKQIPFDHVLQITIVGSWAKGLANSCTTATSVSDYDVKVITRSHRNEYLLQQVTKKKNKTMNFQTTVTLKDQKEKIDIDFMVIDYLTSIEYVFNNNMSAYEFFAGMIIYTNKSWMELLHQTWLQDVYNPFILYQSLMGMLYNYKKKKIGIINTTTTTTTTNKKAGEMIYLILKIIFIMQQQQEQQQQHYNHLDHGTKRITLQSPPPPPPPPFDAFQLLKETTEWIQLNDDDNNNNNKDDQIDNDHNEKAIIIKIHQLLHQERNEILHLFQQRQQDKDGDYKLSLKFLNLLDCALQLQLTITTKTKTKTSPKRNNTSNSNSNITNVHIESVKQRIYEQFLHEINKTI